MGIANFFKNLGPVELIVLLAIVFLFFGPTILRKIGKTSGETVKEIKNIKQGLNEALGEEPTPTEGNKEEA